MSDKLSGFMCIIMDEDFHPYIIPVEYKEKFYEWSEGYITDEDFDYDLFNEFRLNSPISKVAFRDYHLVA